MEIVLYALIAAFFAWRLFNTFGTRHEDGRTRPNPFAGSGSNPSQKDLLALPLELPKPAPKDVALLAAPGPAPASLSGGLYAIQQADPTFEEKAFLKGARMAFEMIVHAFAASEREALQPLVSPVLFEAFKSAIDARTAENERMEIALLNLVDAHIIGAEIKNRFVNVTVEFVSDQARAYYTGEQLKEKEAPQRLHDIWTFRREIGSGNPNWVLVETRTA
jgi:predicted lipid-binding transport protein (Tim44 family)